MTNLADLLPAGGGQNNTDFVADGNISAGAPVILTSDGKAAPISGTSGVVGASATFESATTNETDSVYDSNSNKIVVVYADQANSYYATSVVGTITGGSTNTVSWGTPVVFASYGCSSFAPVFQSHDNQIVCAFVAWGGSYYSRIQVIAGEVSGTSMNWYSSGAHDPDGSTGTNYISAAYDSNAQKTVLAWVKGSATTESCVVSVSGTGTSANATTGTVVQVDGGGDARNTSCCFDSNSNKVVVLFNKVHDSYKGFGRVGTVSGTSISYGTEAQFMSGKQPLYIGSGFDASANKIVITGADNANNSQGDCCLGTVSGTDITYSTPVVFSTGNGSGVSSGQNANGFPTIYNPDTAKTFIAFSNSGDDSSGQYIEGTVSGSTISFGSVTTFEAPVSGQTSVAQISAAYDTNVDRFLVAFVPYATGPSYGVGRVIQVGTSTLTATNLLGLASGAISDTATGTINTWGSRCESVTGPSILSAGSPVTYLSAGGFYGAIAYDTNSDKVVVVNRDDSSTPTGYGVAYVGTVSGTSISYGTQVVFNSGTATDYIDICFDASNNTVVVVYKDGGNSGYGTAIVGTVAGGNITFGSEVVFNSASTDACKVVYDSSNNKVVVSYRDTGNSNYGTAIVGTVSGTSISFGTAAVFDSQAIEADNGSAIAFDTSSNQAIIVYRETATYYINAVTGSVSGTSITFGTPVDISVGGGAGAYHDYPSVCYDSTANKLLFAFREASSAGAGLAKVGTVSGTAISVGTVVEFSSKAKYTSSVFDTLLNQVVISYQEYGTTTYGYLVKATISGTDVTFSTPEVWSGTTPVTYLGTVYDPDTQSIVSTFADSAASYYGKSVVAKFSTELTISSDYYVQTDGSLSTDTGGQLIGKAITATQINIKDYTG